jgi:hypothetical protein
MAFAKMEEEQSRKKIIEKKKAKEKACISIK